MSIWAVVPAAGAGERLGRGDPKALRTLAGRTMIERVVRTFLAAPSIGGMIVVGPEGVLAAARRGSPCVVGAAGGISRQASVRAGLAALPGEADVVLVHDAARPLVSVDLIERVAIATTHAEAVVPALPVTDTIKRSSGELVEETVARHDLWRAQTPQGFAVAALVEAHDRAVVEGFEGTDDASLVERLGIKPVIVEGEEWNIKITTAADLELAESILRMGGEA